MTTIGNGSEIKFSPQTGGRTRQTGRTSSGRESSKIVNMRGEPYCYTSTPPKKVRQNEDGDSFELRKVPKKQPTKQERAERARKARKQRAWRNRALGAVAAILLTTGGNAAIQNITAPHENFNGNGHSIVEVAEWTDVDYRAILLANDMKDKNEEVDDIILPEEYDVAGTQIAAAEFKLDHDDLDSDEIKELEEEISTLQEKQELQQELATVYTDGKYAYIIPNDSVSAESVKEAFGIEDGVIKNYNSLSYSWGSDEYGGYRDYTGSYIPYGGIKVPVDELGNY